MVSTSLSQTPTGELLLKFYTYIIPELVKRRRFKELNGISLSFTQQGMLQLARWLTWKHNNFAPMLTSNVLERLKQQERAFLADGSLWRGRHKEIVHLRAHTVHRMVRSYLTRMLTRGTPD